VRKDTVHERHDEVAEFARTLEAIKVDSKKNLAALLDHYTFKGLTNYQIIDYWETIKYDLSEAHIKGLLKYYSYAAKLGRVKKVPPLDFFVG
jgi:chorismate dehydratase